MGKISEEINDDLNFLGSHTLQPKWYKILKLFILLGFLLGLSFFLGLAHAALFFACFVVFPLLIHCTYRIKTRKFTQSWLDFRIEKDADGKPKRIGKHYYSAVVVSAILSFIISQL